MLRASASVAASVVAYVTNFDTTETPVSESGVWINNGLDWTPVATSGGLALCTQTGDETGSAGYNDSFAHLSGFPADHRVEITLRKDGAVTINGNQECECLLRWASSAHSATGYECMIPRQGSGYGIQIVRWNGPVGDFTQLADFGGHTIADGDKFCAQIVGNVITVSYIPVSTGIESTIGTLDITAGAGAALVHTTGNPGVGLFRRNTSGTNTFPAAFCVTAFKAIGL